MTLNDVRLTWLRQKVKQETQFNYISILLNAKMFLNQNKSLDERIFQCDESCVWYTSIYETAPQTKSSSFDNDKQRKWWKQEHLYDGFYSKTESRQDNDDLQLDRLRSYNYEYRRLLSTYCTFVSNGQ